MNVNFEPFIRGRLMAKTILNFHFDYLNPSLNGNAYTVSYGKVIATPPKDLVVKIVMMLQMTSAAPAAWTPTFTVGSQTVTATGLAVQALDSVSKPRSGLKAEYEDIGS